MTNNVYKKIALPASKTWAAGRFGLVLALSVLAGCSALPDKPVRPVLYDFGPGSIAPQATTRQAPLPAVALEDITTVGGALDNTALLYRLGYANDQQLRPYAGARWSTPPAQLVRQRLREKLSERRPVFGARDGLALNRPVAPGVRPAPSDGTPETLPLRLRLELEEFSHLFTAPEASVGVIRLRATLIDISRGGERLVGQRNIVVQRPATSSDAPGGVRALTAATDAAIEELDQWMQATPVAR
jgi:cholesterol transport system auxiliary component